MIVLHMYVEIFNQLAGYFIHISNQPTDQIIDLGL